MSSLIDAPNNKVNVQCKILEIRPLNMKKGNKNQQFASWLIINFCGMWDTASSTRALLSVPSFESICPHQRSSDGMKWKSSVGQCENIHTHAGVELTQQGVSKWAAFMLLPEAAAVSLHLQPSFLLLIGKTTLVSMGPGFWIKGMQPGLWTRCAL